MKIPSMLLVASQMILIGLLATPLNALMPHNLTTTAGFLLLVVGLLIVAWAAINLSWKNLSVMPEPVSKGTLIQRGPYQYIRHPMYTAVIVCGFGAFIAHGGIVKAVYLLLLIIVLCIKLKREESLLKTTYPDYSSYMDRTSALIPRVF